MARVLQGLVGHLGLGGVAGLAVPAAGVALAVVRRDDGLDERVDRRLRVRHQPRRRWSCRQRAAGS